MRYVLAAAAALAAFGLMDGTMAQTPTPPPAATAPGAGRAQAPLQVPSPLYQSVMQTIDVNAPVAQVWARVGKFCDIGEWGGFAAGCQILSGSDGQLGVVRSIGNEILVGKTQYSYTYTQPVRDGAIYNLYHGTLEARATGPGTTQLLYSLIWDLSPLPEANRAANIVQRQSSATRWLANMKILAEGGTLPPTPPRGGAAPAGGRGN